MFPNKLAPKVSNSMSKNPPFSSFVFFSIFLVVPSRKILESLRALMIFTKSFILSLRSLALLFQNLVFSFEVLHLKLMMQSSLLVVLKYSLPTELLPSLMDQLFYSITHQKTTRLSSLDTCV